MNKILITVLVVVFSVIISGGVVYLILNKEIQEWQLVVNAQEERLIELKQ